MPNRFKKILFSVPVITAVGLFALYLILGFLALPALLKWQAEKQVRESLGHQLSVAQIRFNPLNFTFEVDDLALADGEGKAMLGFKRLHVDFELRSVIDRAWTFAHARLEAPTLQFVLEKDGRHNFQALLDRLGSGTDTTEPETPGTLPRFAVHRLALSEGRIEFSDALLAEPLVTRIEPLRFEIDALSSLPALSARYRLAVPTAAGEALKADGELALNPMRLNGKLVLNKLQVVTLVRGLSRLVTIEAPAGEVEAGAMLDLGLNEQGELTGTVKDIQFGLDRLSLTAPGAAASKLALETIALNQGQIDFDSREASFAALKLTNGGFSAAVDAQGRLDWERVVRVAAVSPAPAKGGAVATAGPGTAAVSAAVAPAPLASGAASRSAPSEATLRPWRVTLAGAELSALAFDVADAGGGRNVRIGALGLSSAARAEIGPAGVQLDLDRTKLSLAGTKLRNGTDTLDLPQAQIESGRLSMSSADRRLSLTLDAPRVATPEGLSATQGEMAFALGSLAVQADAVELGQSGAEATAAISAPRIALSAVMLGQGARLRAALRDASFEAGRITLAAGAEPLDLGIEALQTLLTDLQIEQGDDKLALRSASIAGKKLSLAKGAAGLKLAVDTPGASVAGVAANRADAKAMLDKLSFDGGSLSLSTGSDGRLQLTLAAPQAASGALALSQGGSGLDLAEASVGSESVVVLGGSDGRLEVKLVAPRASTGTLALKQGQDGLDLARASIGGASMSMLQSDGRTDLAGSGLKADVSGVAGRQGKDRVALQEASFAALTLSLSPGAVPAAAPQSSARPANGVPGLQARLEEAALSLKTLNLTALGASGELVRVAAAQVDAKTLQLALAENAPELIGDGLTAMLSGAALRSPADASELVSLGDATLTGASLGLRERRFSADRFTLANTRLRIWLDDQGRFNLTTLFASVAPTEGAALNTTAATTATPPTAPAAQPAWRIAVESADIDDLALGFEDRRESPPFGLGLEAVRARVAGLDTGAPAPMRVEVRAAVASGGAIEATGEVHAARGASDLLLKVSKLALAPVQSYLSKFAELTLAQGTVSTEGRLRYGAVAAAAAAAGGGTGEGEGAGAGAKLAYQGALAVDGLLLEELAPKRPFLSWDTVATSDLLVTLEPNCVDIGELRVDRPAGRLIIAEDQSVNLSDVLKKQAEGDKPDPASAPAKQAATAPKDGAAQDEAFPVSIARVRVADGALEFADLSLRPQFAARMHELKGVISGLGTDASRSAKLQLDARVDKFGSARIRGQLSVLQPERLTEIDMSFRNLEMTSLSPYVAKFAGYRIAAGRLALDLQYKVRDSKLLGENKVELKQVALGEKVDSPGALDLPLDLAIAILKDSDGVIDIGLPVSGNLDDPKFDYGAVIGKAVGNLLGGIVTAPFRALGAIFGGGDKEIDMIAFEPGSDTLAPPEQQKLATVARALGERPNLSLVVPPTFAAEYDTPVLKSLVVRKELAARMGLALQPGEDPGPIDAAEPRAQRAIEAVFSDRYAPEVLAVLKQRALPPAAPAQAPAASASQGTASDSVTKPGAVPGAATSASDKAPASLAAATDAPSAGVAAGVAKAASMPAAPPGPSPAFYQTLLDRLIAEQPIDEPALAQLAIRRGEAVLRELSEAGDVPATSITVASPRKASQADDKAVALRLELKAAR